MAGSDPPIEVLVFARRHARRRHGIKKLPVSAVGPVTARKETTPIAWVDRGSDPLGHLVICRLCEPGFDRYYLSVENPRALPLLEPLVKAHLDEPHRPLKRAGGDEQPQRRTPTVLGITRRQGAMLRNCPGCPTATVRALTTPPYGDARYRRAILEDHPELVRKTLRLTSLERAEYVESWERGLATSDDDVAAARRALHQANSAEPRRTRDRPLDAALKRLLLSEVGPGRGPKLVITELDRLSDHNPLGFAVRLGHVTAALRHEEERMTVPEFARAVARHYGFSEGRYPSARRSKLWAVWTSIPKEVRAAAVRAEAYRGVATAVDVAPVPHRPH